MVVAELADDVVHELEQVGGRQIQARVRLHRRPELTHQARRTDPAPADVRDRERGAAGPEVDHVEPVAADAGSLHAGLVVGGRLEVGGPERRRRQQAALQRIGDRVLTLGSISGGRRRRDRLFGLASLGDVLNEASEHHRRAVLVRSPLRAPVSSAPHRSPSGCSRTSDSKGSPDAIADASAARTCCPDPRDGGDGGSPRGRAARQGPTRSLPSIRRSCSELRLEPVERSSSQLPTSASRSA